MHNISIVKAVIYGVVVSIIANAILILVITTTFPS